VALLINPNVQSVDYDIAIVGGGVVGCIAAYQLAPDHDVVVIEKDKIGGDATSRASGVVTTTSVYPEYPEMGEHAMDFFKQFDGTGTYSFTQREKVHMISDEIDEEVRQEAQREGVTLLEADELEEHYPEMFGDLSDYAGALLYRNTGVTDPSEYASSLKHAAEGLGAEFRTDTEVKNVLLDGDSVTGVETEYETLHAENVVIAANWYSRELLDGVIELPVRPFRWNAMVFDVGEDVSHYPLGAETDLEIYWRPTPEGNLLVGGGEHFIEDPHSPSAIVDAFDEKVRTEVPSLLRTLEDATVIRNDCCPTGDSATPDTWPIIDAPDEGPEGLVIASGFQRGGVMTSPITGTAVRSLITGEECPFPLEPFKLDRLKTRHAEFDFVSLYDVEV